jgi:hypothetical protein
VLVIFLGVCMYRACPCFCLQLTAASGLRAAYIDELHNSLQQLLPIAGSELPELQEMGVGAMIDIVGNGCQLDFTTRLRSLNITNMFIDAAAQSTAVNVPASLTPAVSSQLLGVALAAYVHSAYMGLTGVCRPVLHCVVGMGCDPGTCL